MNTLELAKLKQHLLQEIEELDELNMPKPEDAYPFKTETKSELGYGDYYLYTFENNKGDQMEVSCLAEFPKKENETGLSLYVAFGYEKEVIEPEDEEEKYTKQTGANDMLKVMATVVEAIKRTFKKVGGVDNVKDIKFSPSDERRSNIYDHYIETLFGKDSGDYHFEKDPDSSSEMFTVYKNKNYVSSNKPK